MCGLNLVLFYRQSFNNEILKRKIGIKNTEGEKILQGQVL